ncbi:DUF1801 domain containing protein [Lysobacter dokdonensis DS-58]|uniref:DUF1801 domain containing protein n=1 Tax=Lysobacter dokdonensis DS-58 TaxID=1300345 RepID=A0A0A2WH78_9GAMM|nr:DUF1761 domain-containing protein [Lysobacter dokdonensis]KGQ18062.1 DUF1801 domain containing protein [Lysobacter dokdonensis DS-58]
MHDLNWLAIIAAAVSAFLLGGIWYGPLFKNAWCREAGVDPNAKPKSHPAKTFAIAFVASLVAAYGFAMLLHLTNSGTELWKAVHAGVMVGFFYVAMSFGINYAFAGRSLKLWLIDAGYHILQFALYGVILGLWH